MFKSHVDLFIDDRFEIALFSASASVSPFSAKGCDLWTLSYGFAPPGE